MSFVAEKKENRTKNFVLRMDHETMEAIEKWAAEEFRSTNGQIQYLLEQALIKSGRKKR
ncbi:MAG: Arc family DNA-binding protein [Bacteroidia bacterium]|nr:Arc family DNA-binding protein [Bacteroidia bacterium]